MRRTFLAFFISLIACAPVLADERHVTLGFGRIFSNDGLGDFQDRWRTGSYAVSWVRGVSWDGALPGAPGEVVEFRFRADLIAPANLVAPAAGDRPYVGALSFGVHSHWQARGTEISAGVGLVGVGPQTGLGGLQSLVHEVLGMASPAAALAGQIPDAIHPSVALEAGRVLPLGQSAALRPFVAVEAGAENLVRIGGEITFGEVWNGALMLRDTATGQRYAAVRSDATGFGAVLGGDLAYVQSSAWLPESAGYRLTDVRARARAGLRWQGEKSTVFYGLTWLGREFVGQPAAQVLGSLSLDIKF
jgi:hypothetical protein